MPVEDVDPLAREGTPGEHLALDEGGGGAHALDGAQFSAFAVDLESGRGRADVLEPEAQVREVVLLSAFQKAMTVPNS